MILPSAGATLSSILSLQRSETAYARPPFDKARSNCGQLLSSGRVYGRQPCSAGSTSAWSVSESTLSESGESGGGAWRRALRLAWRLLGASSSPCSPRRMGTARHTLRRAERGECTCLQLSGCTSDCDPLLEHRCSCTVSGNCSLKVLAAFSAASFDCVKVSLVSAGEMPTKATELCPPCRRHVGVSMVLPLRRQQRIRATLARIEALALPIVTASGTRLGYFDSALLDNSSARVVCRNSSIGSPIMDTMTATSASSGCDRKASLSFVAMSVFVALLRAARTFSAISSELSSSAADFGMRIS